MKRIILIISLFLIPYLQITAQTIEGKQEFCVKTPQTYSLSITQGEGSNQLSHTIWSFGDGTEKKDNNIASGKQTQLYTYTKPGEYTIIVKSFRTSDNSEVIEKRQSLKITVLSCIIPVNPNIHLYNNN